MQNGARWPTVGALRVELSMVDGRRHGKFVPGGIRITINSKIKIKKPEGTRPSFAQTLWRAGRVCDGCMTLRDGVRDGWDPSFNQCLCGL